MPAETGPPLTPEFKPGELVLGNIFHDGTAGKWRPVVLVHETRRGWAVMGLTTSERYSDGNRRPRVPGWRDCGLTGPGWLWSTRLVDLPRSDLTAHIGWATPELVALIAGSVDLSPAEAAEFTARPQG